MKTLAFAFVTAISSLAFAYPALKDQANFKGTVNGAAGGQIDFTQTLELVSYDQAKDTFVMKNTFVVNGQTQSQDAEIAKSQFPSQAQIQQILANCEASGGVSEELTLPAGVLKTCHGPTENNGEIWLADVPFGIAKQIAFDEEQNKITVELQSFVNGQ